MAEEKKQERALALLALAVNEERNADSESNAQTSACPDPEEIAALAEGRLSWERRHRLTRHLAACPECYRLWLAAARQGGGSPTVAWSFPWRWPRLSWPTLGYAGGALIAVTAGLAVFLHPPSGFIQPPTPPPAAPAIIKQSQSESQTASAQKNAPLRADGGISGTDENAGQEDDIGEWKRAWQAAENKRNDSSGLVGTAKKQAEAGPFADKSVAKPAPAASPAQTTNSIHLGAVEVRRSSNQLTAWYSDLRQMCRQPNFKAAQWTALYSRGADILEAFPENAQNEETDRLLLILGQMEGLTAERFPNFCAWSNKELDRKLGKKRRSRR